MKRRALLVDDERQARKRLERLLAVHSDSIEIVGEAADGLAAVESIQTLKPDVVFLDIEMPGLDGFEVLDSLPQDSWPIVVFVTAYGHYAIRAFEVHAVDYLMKPVNAERLAECVTRLTTVRLSPHRESLEQARTDQRQLRRLMVRSGAKLVVLNVDDVVAFESEDRLVFARTSQGRFVLSVTMKELESRLDPEVFCRVHKQAIVRLSQAREVHPMPGGQYLLKMADGAEVPIGRNYAREFRARFE